MFRSLIKVNNDGIIISQDDNILFFNEKMRQIFNVSEKVPNYLSQD